MRRTAYVKSSKGVREALRHRQQEAQSRALGLQLDQLTDTQITLLQTILSRVKDTHKAIDRMTDAAHGQQMELFGQMIALETQAKAGKEVKIPPPKISEGLRKAIELRIELELALMRDLHLLLAMEPVTAQMLIRSPDMLGNIKNRILGLDDEDHADMLLRNLKQSALLPVASAARVFVLQFKGDVFATGLNAFREEVTALLSIARPGDEVLIRLNSGGGTVTGYGLGAAQIDRMKKAGYKVSVAVDEVAASGGYLMAAVADRIYASPFAVIGSIGVVMTVPNFADRMQREGVSMEEITAGKFKRTIVPYKKPTYEDRAKVKEEIESVLDLFKAYLTVHRPALNVDALATGETWYGPQALARGLVDELTTFDDLVLQHAAQGKAVYMLSVKPFKPRFPGLMDDTADEQASWVDRAVQMVVGALAKAVVGALQGGLGVDVSLQGQEEGQGAYTKHMAYDPVHGSGQGPRF